MSPAIVRDKLISLALAHHASDSPAAEWLSACASCCITWVANEAGQREPVGPSMADLVRLARESRDVPSDLRRSALGLLRTIAR